MTGLIEFGGVWKKRGQVYGVPGLLGVPDVLEHRRHATGGREHARRDLRHREGNNRLPEIPSVPYLDVVAAMNDPGDR